MLLAVLISEYPIHHELCRWFPTFSGVFLRINSPFKMFWFDRWHFLNSRFTVFTVLPAMPFALGYLGLLKMLWILHSRVNARNCHKLYWPPLSVTISLLLHLPLSMCASWMRFSISLLKPVGLTIFLFSLVERLWWILGSANGLHLAYWVGHPLQMFYVTICKVLSYWVCILISSKPSVYARIVFVIKIRELITSFSASSLGIVGCSLGALESASASVTSFPLMCIAWT